MLRPALALDTRHWRALPQRGRFLLQFVFGFGVYGLACLLFIPCLPLLFIAAFGQGPRYHRWVQTINHWTFRGVRHYLRWIGFIDIRTFSHTTAPSSLLIANHISMFDIVATFAHFPHCYTLVKSKYLKNPVIAPIIRAAGLIPINSEDPASRHAALAQVEALLQRGERVIVFPEGTRSRTGELATFETGIFRLACRLGIPVTPIFFTADQAIFYQVGIQHSTRGCVRFHMHVGEARLAPDLDTAVAKAYKTQGASPATASFHHTDSRNRVAGRLFRDTLHHYFVLMQATKNALPWNFRPMTYLGVPLRIDEFTPSHVKAHYHVSESHPDFAGHFPTFPVLPGVSQIELVMSLLSHCLGTPLQCLAVRRAKFTGMIHPETTVTVSINYEAHEAQWTLTTEGQILSKGNLAYARGDHA